MTFNIERWIGLGITKPLGVAQTFVEGEPLLLHPREDVIAGTVEDAVDAGERITAQPFAQSLDDRNAGTDRRFEIERDVMPFRSGG